MCVDSALLREREKRDFLQEEALFLLHRKSERGEEFEGADRLITKVVPPRGPGLLKPNGPEEEGAAHKESKDARDNFLLTTIPSKFLESVLHSVRGHVEK